jgi:RNA polymerase sigma-70 factor (family 1)
MRANNLFYLYAKDVDLFSLVKASDEKAFEELYNRHWPILFNVACRRLDSRQKAEDIVQNIFVDLYSRRAAIEFTVSLRAYLLRALKFKVINEYRSASYRNKLRRSLFVDETRKVDFTHPLEAKDLERRIDLILDRLPEKCKKVFLLSRKENLSYKDISDGLCITVSAVEKHISKALKILKYHIRPTG